MGARATAAAYLDDMKLSGRRDRMGYQLRWSVLIESFVASSVSFSFSKTTELQEIIKTYLSSFRHMSPY